jgi:predicted aldo/keto reductase-like oxidoreductase
MKKENEEISRRDFVKKTSKGLAAIPGLLAVSSCTDKSTLSPANQKSVLPPGAPQSGNHHNNSILEDTIPKRILGKTGLEVSMLAFGGGSQFLKNPDGEWEPLLQRAIDMGINFYDTSHNYGTEERFGEMLSPIRDQVIISTKFDARYTSGMKSEFEGSLKRLNTDYVDILLIHGVEKDDNVSIIEKGVYKEMQDLKSQGVARFIGFSSMDSASKSKEMIEKLDFDVCILALNATRYGSYDDVALPAAVAKNMGVLAIKVMKYVVGVSATADELLHYALDLEGVCSAIIGHYGMNILEENAELIKKFSTSTGVAYDYQELERRLKPLAGPHVLCWARPDYVDGMLV